MCLGDLCDRLEGYMDNILWFWDIICYVRQCVVLCYFVGVILIYVCLVYSFWWKTTLFCNLCCINDLFLEYFSWLFMDYIESWMFFYLNRSFNHKVDILVGYPKSIFLVDCEHYILIKNTFMKHCYHHGNTTNIDFFL